MYHIERKESTAAAMLFPLKAPLSAEKAEKVFVIPSNAKRGENNKECPEAATAGNLVIEKEDSVCVVSRIPACKTWRCAIGRFGSQGVTQRLRKAIRWPVDADFRNGRIMKTGFPSHSGSSVKVNPRA